MQRSIKFEDYVRSQSQYHLFSDTMNEAIERWSYKKKAEGNSPSDGSGVLPPVTGTAVGESGPPPSDLLSDLQKLELGTSRFIHRCLTEFEMSEEQVVEALVARKKAIYGRVTDEEFQAELNRIRKK